MSEPTLPWALWRQRLGAAVRRAAPFTAGMTAALAAILLYNFIVPGPTPLTANDVNESIVQAFASATPPPSFSAQVYRVIQPSLVLIQVETPGEEGEPGHGVGSGVIISDQGDILTSLHVVEDATQIMLTFADGTEAEGQVLVRQPENDIAVLQAGQLPELLVPAVLGNPYGLRVGDEAFVVGNPLGLYSSMSAGVISGLGRSFKPPDSSYKLQDLIQIDAAVNPGNSGGPLLNRHGHVVGIVTALVNPTEQEVFIGIGFAVPITIAAGAVGSLPY